MNLILADANLDVSWSDLSPWIKGLIAFLVLAALVLNVLSQVKKNFGRKPPIDDSLKSLADHFDASLKEVVKHYKAEIAREKNSVLKELRLKLEPLVDRVEKTEAQIEEIHLDRARKWEELQKEIHALDLSLTAIKTKLEGK